MSSKKAQANTFWIIIGAVIALVVLIVLLIMFTSKGSTLEQGLLDCESKNGVCTFYDPQECRTAGGTPSSAFQCEDTRAYCCILSPSADQDSRR